MSLPLALAEAVAARAKELHASQAHWVVTQCRSEHAAGLDPRVREIEERRYAEARERMETAEAVRDLMHTAYVAKLFARVA